MIVCDTTDKITLDVASSHCEHALPHACSLCYAESMGKRSVVRNSCTAVGYIRVSTKQQFNGPEVQGREIQAWAERQGIELLAVYIDRCSGNRGFEKRPGFVAALAAMAALGAGNLVAQKRDRVARGPVVMAGIEDTIRRARARLRTADGACELEGLAGYVQRSSTDFASGVERESIRERTVQALREKRTRGEALGHVPYGFRAVLGPERFDRKRREMRPVKLLAPHPEEQAVLALCAQLRASGLSTRAIARELSAKGYTSRTGRAFLQTQVMRMLAPQRESEHAA